MIEYTLKFEADNEGLTDFDIARKIYLLTKDRVNGLNPVAIASMLMAEVKADEKRSLLTDGSPRMDGE